MSELTIKNPILSWGGGGGEGVGKFPMPPPGATTRVRKGELHAPKDSTVSKHIVCLYTCMSSVYVFFFFQNSDGKGWGGGGGGRGWAQSPCLPTPPP